MEPAESLREEHALIARMLEVLDTFVGTVETGGRENRHDLVLLVTFFREFADLVHHEKEEGLVLPALVRAGMSWEDGTLDSVRKDHNMERYLMQSLRHASLQSREWSPDNRRHLSEVARSFTAFMRRHIAKEEATLIPALEQRLDPAATDTLRTRMQRFDARFRDSGEAEVMQSLAHELWLRYGSPE